MRLLDAKTGQFRFVHDPRSVRYAIISHTWSQEGEQTYQDMLEIQTTANNPVHAANHPGTEDHECAHHASCPLYSTHSHPLGSKYEDDVEVDQVAAGKSDLQPLEPLWRCMSRNVAEGILDSLRPSVEADSPSPPRSPPSFPFSPFVAALNSARHLLLNRKLIGFVDPFFLSLALDDDFPTVDPSSPPPRPTTPSQSLPGPGPKGSSHDHVPSLGPDMPSDPDHDHASLPGCILHNPQTAHKARMACILAQLHSVDLVWLDSCCIDKASSAELSEAINSMYEWYEISAVCFVHLADVDVNDDPSGPNSQFRKSRWHRRGWTLQELIAPRYVLFFSKHWQLIGTKVSLAPVLHEITGIDTLVLLHQIPVDVVSVAQRMQWASARETTRVEDEAYSLMGIFNVHMATIYGEGRHAFIRLQEEILKHTNDQSIFAWGPRWNGKNPTEDREAASYHEYGTRLLEQAPFIDMYGLLASSPAFFRGARGITIIRHDQFLAKLGIDEALPPPEYTLSYDIRTRLPLLPFKELIRHAQGGIYMEQVQFDYLALLECQDEDGNVVGLPLRNAPHLPANQPLFTGALSKTADDPFFYRIWPISPKVLEIYLAHIRLEDVRVFRRPYNIRLDGMSMFDVRPRAATAFPLIMVSPEPWCLPPLALQGFAVTSVARKEVPGVYFYLTRLHVRELERITIVLHTDHDRSGWASRKMAHRIEGVSAFYQSSRVENARPGSFENRRCGKVMDESALAPFAPRTKWSLFRLHCSTAGYVRYLRVSVLEVDIKREQITPTVTIEISEPTEIEEEAGKLDASSDSGDSLEGRGEFYKDRDRTEFQLLTLFNARLTIPPRGAHPGTTPMVTSIDLYRQSLKMAVLVDCQNKQANYYKMLPYEEIEDVLKSW